MSPEKRAIKKQKRSIERKKKALKTYEESFNELDGTVISWPFSPRPRRSPERLKAGLQKGIEQLRWELQNAIC